MSKLYRIKAPGYKADIPMPFYYRLLMSLSRGILQQCDKTNGIKLKHELLDFVIPYSSLIHFAAIKAPRNACISLCRTFISLQGLLILFYVKGNSLLRTRYYVTSSVPTALLHVFSLNRAIVFFVLKSKICTPLSPLYIIIHLISTLDFSRAILSHSS